MHPLPAANTRVLAVPKVDRKIKPENSEKIGHYRILLTRERLRDE